MPLAPLRWRTSWCSSWPSSFPSLRSIWNARHSSSKLRAARKIQGIHRVAPTGGGWLLLPQAKLSDVLEVFRSRDRGATFSEQPATGATLFVRQVNASRSSSSEHDSKYVRRAEFFTFGEPLEKSQRLSPETDL